jgi:hypothetical protein
VPRLIRKLVPETRTIDGVRYRVLREPEVPSGARAVQVEEFDSSAVDSLDFLESARDSLTHLIVTNLQIRDVSAISRLERLRSLTLRTGKLRRGVDVSPTELEYLALDWSVKLEALLSSPQLRDLAINSPPPDVPVAGMRLDMLMLKGVRAVRLPAVHVETLVIARGVRRGNISGLQEVQGLRDLTLDGVVPADLPDRPTPAFAGLRRLVLEDCRNIPSLLPFADAELDELIVVGDVAVQDGSLDRLTARKSHLPPGYRTGRS